MTNFTDTVEVDVEYLWRLKRVGIEATWLCKSLDENGFESVLTKEQYRILSDALDAIGAYQSEKLAAQEVTA
jgi:hypothetical protein